MQITDRRLSCEFSTKNAHFVSLFQLKWRLPYKKMASVSVFSVPLPYSWRVKRAKKRLYGLPWKARHYWARMDSFHSKVDVTLQNEKSLKNGAKNA